MGCEANFHAVECAPAACISNGGVRCGELSVSTAGIHRSPPARVHFFVIL